MNRDRTPRRRGVAMLMVLISMVTAMTLVMGWLAAQDNSALLGNNASKAAAGRAAAQAGLEVAVALLESEAPWQTQHDEGWILRDHPLGGGLVDIRLIDDMTGAPPDLTSTVLRIETTARMDGMTQQARALATVHPYDNESLGDLSGYALFADDELDIRGNSRVRSWHDSGRGLRSVACSGDWTIRGRAARDLAHGDLRLFGDAESSSSNDSRVSGVLPSMLGALGLDAIDLPGLGESHDDGEADEDDTEAIIVRRNRRIAAGTTIHAEGDFVLRSNAVLTLEGDADFRITGRLVLESGSAIRVTPGSEVLFVVGGDVDITRSVIGVRQERAPRHEHWHQSDITWGDPSNIRLVSAGTNPEVRWRIRDRSLVQGVIQAPNTHVEIERAAVLGRVAAGSISMRRHARLYFDHRLDSLVGLAPLSDLIERLDLLDRREGGLDDHAAAKALERLASLLERPRGSTASPPADGWWTQRPVPVECHVQRCGGDITRWEDAALAAADGREH